MNTTVSKLREIELKYDPAPPSKTAIRSAIDANMFVNSIIPEAHTRKEHFVLVLLNAGKKVIGYNIISVGGQTATIVDPAEVARIAILCNAHSVLLAHNHPSGNMQPSTADRTLTRKIKEGLELFYIAVVDHIIIDSTDEFNYYSFSEDYTL